MRSSPTPETRATELDATSALFALPLDEILRRTGEQTAYPGGGAASAAACASAASLVAMAARFTGDAADHAVIGAAIEAVIEADAAIEELRGLADADAAAFGELLAAWSLPAEHADRPDRVAAAARGACDVPLRICQLGATIARHGTWLAVAGKRDLRGDAFTGVQLANAAVQAAARLVEVNAGEAADRSPAEEARQLAADTRHLLGEIPPAG